MFFFLNSTIQKQDSLHLENTKTSSCDLTKVLQGFYLSAMKKGKKGKKGILFSSQAAFSFLFFVQKNKLHTGCIRHCMYKLYLQQCNYKKQHVFLSDVKDVSRDRVLCEEPIDRVVQKAVALRGRHV